MSTPAVSVILPTLNRAAVLPRSIASVLGQTWRDFELIVVDDGSTDDTQRLLASVADPRVRSVVNDGAHGDAAARNCGLAHARGTWIAFQDSDDEWAPHKLMRQMEWAARSAEDVLLIGSELLRVTPSRIEHITWPTGPAADGAGEIDRERFLAGLNAYLQSVMIRREAIQAVGGFDTGMRARSDFDLCLRVLQIGRGIALSEVLAISYESADGISLRSDFAPPDLAYLLGKHRHLLDASRAARGRFEYDLARACLACNHRGAAMHHAFRAWFLGKFELRALALFFASPLGVKALALASALRRHGRS